MDQSVTHAAIALGSNLGDRDAYLRFAVEQLSASLTDLRVSRFSDTAPMGVGSQPDYLNGAVVGATRLSPLELLEQMLDIEQRAGRERPWPGAPRSLDLDLILHGAAVIDMPRLQLPHPRFRERAFVLEPLAEIAPDLVDPVTGKTIGVLWDELNGTHGGPRLSLGQTPRGAG
jgi:2-amino-4-hydroxy-6-hydroxymethyldihydropteridine diphosphokinase